MSKVIFLDIDGTLVNFKGKMPESTKKALSETRKRGNRIVLCTGRVKCQIYPWLFEHGFDGVVAATGAYVECDGKVIYQHFLDKKALSLVVDTLNEAQAVYALQTANCLVATQEHMDVMFQMMYDMGISERMAQSVIGVGKVREQVKEVSTVEKLIYYHSQKDLSFMQERLSDYFDVTASSLQDPGETDGEITCKDINKAYGIQQYIDYLGIPQKDTIAVGDGPNDFDMLTYADIGIAMGNGSEALKERADYITTDIDEDGIWNAFSHFDLL